MSATPGRARHYELTLSALPAAERARVWQALQQHEPAHARLLQEQQALLTLLRERFGARPVLAGSPALEALMADPDWTRRMVLARALVRVPVTRPGPAIPMEDWNP